MKSRALRVLRDFSVVILIGVLYALFGHFTGLWIKCPVHNFTGLLCPGCGITNLMRALIRFDFVKAFNSNPVVFCILPVLFVIKVVRCYRYIRYDKVVTGRIEKVLTYVILIALLAFGVIRNII